MGDENVPPEMYVGESRKANKPLMERRRRQRINNCLNELKQLLESINDKESTSYLSKLEKADILEMTVRCVRNLRRHQTTGRQDADSYATGFDACTQEVARCLQALLPGPSTPIGLPSNLHAGLLQHLSACRRRLVRSTNTNTSTASAPAAGGVLVLVEPPSESTRTRDHVVSRVPLAALSVNIQNPAAINRMTVAPRDVWFGSGDCHLANRNETSSSSGVIRQVAPTAAATSSPFPVPGSDRLRMRFASDIQTVSGPDRSVGKVVETKVEEGAGKDRVGCERDADGKNGGDDAESVWRPW